MATNRNSLAQWEKYQGFKRAFDTYKAYLSAGQYLAAYVVAFSLFEDRVTACTMLASELRKKQHPPEQAPLRRKIQSLREHLEPEARKLWDDARSRRNILIHEAMWSIGVINKEDCDRIIGIAHQADTLSRNLKREVSKSSGS